MSDKTKVSACLFILGLLVIFIAIWLSLALLLVSPWLVSLNAPAWIAAIISIIVVGSILFWIFVFVIGVSNELLKK